LRVFRDKLSAREQNTPQQQQTEMSGVVNVVRHETHDLIVNGAVSADAVSEALGEISTSVDVFFLLFSGYLVFMMQAGFAMLTAGSVRSKNTKNVLLKNMLDASAGVLAYFLFGWAFAYGPGHNKFIGWGNFALTSYKGEAFNENHKFFFQWAFAATATTIVSGSVAERTSFYAYLAYAFILTGFVYPVVTHWTWSTHGFLSDFLGATFIDFAGCGAVHTVGGFAGLAGAIVVGPRLGRFDSEGKVVPIPGHSATLCTLGTFLLWFGWYGFNPGSTASVIGVLRDTAARCAVNTTLAAGAAGVTTLFVIKLRDHIFDLVSCLNGILAGLVSITASCAFVDGWAAIVIGMIGACVYICAAMLLLPLKIDDPLEAFPIHGGCGLWGLIAGALFNRKVHQVTAGYTDTAWGLFYGGGGKLLLCNILGGIIIAAWTLLITAPMFMAMHAAGILRISPEMEIIGNDVSKHGGVAYPIDAAVAAEKAAAKEIDNLGMDDSLKEAGEV
jgi:ammonium transporter, Amt family